MPYSEAQKKATMKYKAKAYDRLELQLKKGTKDIYRKHAEKKGMSLNSYFIYLIEQDMQRD